MKLESKTWLVGIISAVAASLCCITPVLALIAGSSGLASTFSWLEPARPYLIGASILVLGFTWYQKLKPKEGAECACENEEKPSFWQSKAFLATITLFAILMILFPYYSKVFFPNNEKQVITVDKSDIRTAEFKISGMTCQGCTEEVKYEVNKLNGIVKIDVSYDEGQAEVGFDKTKTDIEEIAKAINSTGYKVTQSEIKK